MDRQSQERSMDENGTSSRRESNTFVSSSERRTSSYNQSSTSTVNEPSAVAPIENLTLTTTTTTSKSFLQDRTPVRGMQDIIGRMRAGDAGKNKKFKINKTKHLHFTSSFLRILKIGNGWTRWWWLKNRLFVIGLVISIVCCCNFTCVVCWFAPWRCRPWSSSFLSRWRGMSCATV